MAEPVSGGITANSFKSVFELLGRLSSAKAYAESSGIVSDLMEKVTSLHGDYVAMAESHAALKAELAELKDFAREKVRYVSNNEDSGVVTYRLKAPAEANEQTHRFCPNCFLKRQISYMQPTTRTVHDSRRAGWYRIHRCHSCNTDLAYDFQVERQTPGGYGSTMA
ncbi:MAG: hypothetical protein JSS00_02725 [Proteobacteria bacterium]|nr:hypothetical protein [Pseudomonadota bacterium]